MAFSWWWRNYGADPNFPSSYTIKNQSPFNCPGSGKICALYADDSGLGSPIIDSALRAEMITALTLGINQFRVQIRGVN